MNEKYTELDELLKCVSVDICSGVVTWTKPTNRKICIGQSAGVVDKNGYTVIGFKGKKFFRHHIIWYVIHGTLPEKPYVIDHVHGVELGDGFLNLQKITQQQNIMKKKVQRNNKSGHKGVHWCNTYNKWVAKIKFNGKSIYIREYDDLNDAINARIRKSPELFGKFGEM